MQTFEMNESFRFSIFSCFISLHHINLLSFRRTFLLLCLIFSPMFFRILLVMPFVRLLLPLLCFNYFPPVFSPHIHWVGFFLNWFFQKYPSDPIRKSLKHAWRYIKSLRSEFVELITFFTSLFASLSPKDTTLDLCLPLHLLFTKFAFDLDPSMQISAQIFD